MNIIGIIPARYNSSRFPGKPLVDIGGKPMIQRVYEQAQKSSRLKQVIIATDDERIFDVAKKFGALVYMTSDTHPSGTDRCAEVLEKLHDHTDVIINIQGDEPFIDPRQIDLLCHCFSDPQTEIATLVIPIKKNEELFNPNTPKVVFNTGQFALYFSRSPIPHYRGRNEKDWLDGSNYYKHIGLYGYRAETLRKITHMLPSPLELTESLEQLRWLENGIRIKIALTELETIAIDSPEDLKKISHLI